MLERGKTDLHLRHDVPLGPGAAGQFLAAHDFDRWSPRAAIAVFFGECLSNVQVQANFLGELAAQREGREQLSLKNEIVGQHLPE